MFLSLACCQWRIVRRWVILLRISCIRTYYERWVLDISWMLWYWNCVRCVTRNSKISERQKPKNNTFDTTRPRDRPCGGSCVTHDLGHLGHGDHTGVWVT
ncbi:hypothetical protein EPI10_027551 [Gossypium australe]|uniref:Secreted protein n=1 Tax=Gossypium australe TaxID=47621 RepID=A0A5B6UTY7_9ROSI|nr:hypothetical protein EPI10_027551 [Gossypium australe]